MNNKVIYIASTNLSPSDEIIAELIKRGNSIFMTTSCGLNESVSNAHIVCHSSVEQGLAEDANNVVECTEMFGGIDILLYAKWIDRSEKLFLDVNKDEIEPYLEQIKELFTLCKCAVPYMLGRENALILLPIDNDVSTINAPRAIYTGACISAVNVLSAEFADYGLQIKTMKTNNGPIDVIRSLL